MAWSCVIFHNISCVISRCNHQVAALGCKSFAVLFDDIDNEMLLVDAKEFPSFAHAQVVLTNDVYAHLGKPGTFLFCPTGTPMPLHKYRVLQNLVEDP